jgi:ferredoxin-fold anticodon binding domain-containing protein
MQRVENLLRRYRGQVVNIKTCSGGVYEGEVNDVTSDYVALKLSTGGDGQNMVFLVMHTIESLLPRGPAE